MRSFIKKLNNETRTHCNRVSKLGEEFGYYLNLEVSKIEKLKIGGLLHDVGKLKIPISILEKKGKLTSEEYQNIKKHSLYGKEILLNYINDIDIIQIVSYHHERIDGKGYPYGLRGGDIGSLPKIISLCDSFDAIISRRVYKEEQNIEWAISEIDKNLSIQFDESLGKKFIQFIQERKEKIY